MRTSTPFKLYRYQLLPLDRNATKDMFSTYSVEEMVALKNTFFAQALASMKDPKWGDSTIIVKVKELIGDLISIQFAPSRPLVRETPDSRREKVDHWPHIAAFALNSPHEQLLLVQVRQAAFASTDTVVNLIQKGTKRTLESIGLTVQVEPLFDKKLFWSLVEKHRNRITEVGFEFITPNMANISKVLADSLKTLAKQSNAVREELTLTSHPATSLDIPANDPLITGLVDYSSEGGGNISLKIKGLRKRLHTSKAVREIDISELELTAEPAQLLQILRELTK